MQTTHPRGAFAKLGKYSLVASICALIALAATAWPGAANAGAFLNLTGIPGESTNAQHKNEIDILSYELSLVLPRATLPNRASSRPACPPVTLLKNLDTASPALATRLFQGVYISRAVLTLQREGANPTDYFILTMDEALVNEFSQVTSADPSRVVERVVLTARKYELDYRPQTPTGGQYAIKANWDCVTGEVN
jgi:type VI secretion system secreted protein Hcp